MNDAPARYETPADKDRAARVRLEAYALRSVLDLEPGDRPEACAKLEAAAYALRPWLVAVRHEVTAAPAAGLPALWTVLERAHLKAERDAMAAAGVDLDKLLHLDPKAARQAYAAALADTKRAGVLARARSARAMLDGVETAATDADRRALMLDAGQECNRAEREAEDKPLADEWQAHLATMKDPEPGPDKVLRLNRRRGPWATWCNNWLGERGGLEPGETLILGGAWGAGKTSLAALFAVDALAVGCPVLFWQLELGRARMLEHLQAQRPDLDGWPTGKFWDRASKPLPDAWADLLTIPRNPAPEVEAVLEALHAQAHRARKLGRHACKGLVLVDYAQLLTVAAAGPRQAGHEILTTAASWLAKAADESGACVLLLSQVNKGNQQTGIAGGTALAGADLARMGSRVAIVQKVDRKGAAYKDGGEPVDKEAGKGERRRLTWWKARGVRHADGNPPDDEKDFWTGGQSRALHGGDADAGKGGLAYE